MEPFEMIQTILTVMITGSIAFLVGWLAASQSTRAEAFKIKLHTYRRINQLASGVFFESIKYQKIQEKNCVSLASARIELSEFLVGNSLIISQNIADISSPLLSAELPPNIDQILKSMNSLTTQMSTELKLDGIKKDQQFFT
jgi:hypothetical protein